MPRIAFYSHDTFGLGHLRRCLKLARAIAPRVGAREGLMITGSAWAHLFAAPPGFRWLRLPPLVKSGRGYVAREPSIDLSTLLTRRREQIAAAVLTFRPDLFIVDNVPCGLRGEALAALRLAKARRGCRCVLALRDVLDDPETVAREWAAVGADEALQALYDEVWVFGRERDVQRLRVLESLSTEKVVACGRLPVRSGTARGVPHAEPAPGRPNHADPATPAPARRARRPRVLVTGGGGGDAETLVSTYALALRSLQPPVTSRIVLGPDFPTASFESIRQRNGFAARIDRFVPDLPGAMREADLVVAMAGYNTVCEIEASGRRAVLVPRVWPRREQWIRACDQQLEGRAIVVPPEALGPRSLMRAIESALNGPAPRPPVHRGDVVAAHRAGALLGCAVREV